MKKQFVLVLLILLLLPRSGFAQQSETVYSLVYSTLDQVYVATLTSDGQWQTQTLPPEIWMGQLDIDLLTPRWGTDGHTLFTPLFDLNEYRSSNTIAVYDAQQRAIVQQIPVFERTSGIYDAPFIRDVSPDQRYLYVYQVIDLFKPYLIDRETGTALPTDCYAAPLVWFEDAVLTSNLPYGQYMCDAGLSLVDLKTGQVINSYPAYEAGEDPTLEHAALLSDGRILLGEPGYLDYQAAPVGLLEIDGTVTYWGLGDRLSISDDGHYAAYVDETQTVVRIDLQTLSTERVGQSPCLSEIQWEGDTLRFWEGSDSMFQVQLTGSERQEVYSGPPAKSFSFSPSLDEVAIVLPGGQIEIRQAGTDPVIVPLPPDQAFYLNNLTDVVTWSGDWLHLVEQKSGSTISFNRVTGDLLPAPAPGAQVVSISPDGKWWLYAISGTGLAGEDQLFLFNPDTAEKIVLLENVNLGQQNSHFFPWKYYIWSR